MEEAWRSLSVTITWKPTMVTKSLAGFLNTYSIKPPNVLVIRTVSKNNDLTAPTVIEMLIFVPKAADIPKEVEVSCY